MVGLVLGDDLVAEAVDLPFVGDVAGPAEGPGIVRGDLVQPVQAPRANEQPVPVVGQRPGQGRADPGTRPRQDDVQGRGGPERPP